MCCHHQSPTCIASIIHHARIVPTLTLTAIHLSDSGIALLLVLHSRVQDTWVGNIELVGIMCLVAPSGHCSKHISNHLFAHILLAHCPKRGTGAKCLSRSEHWGCTSRLETWRWTLSRSKELSSKRIVDSGRHHGRLLSHNLGIGRGLDRRR